MSWFVHPKFDRHAANQLVEPGFLFRAQPTLMTMERSAKIMDEIFASPEEEGKGRLLKIIQDFLFSEAAKHSAKEKGLLSDLCVPVCYSDQKYRIHEDQGKDRSEYG